MELNLDEANLLIAHEVGHVIAAIAFNLDIEYVTLSLESNGFPHVKLQKNIESTHASLQEIACFFRSSTRAFQLWWELYENQTENLTIYNKMKDLHDISDKESLDKILTKHLKSDKEYDALNMEAKILTDEIFKKYSFLLLPIHKQLKEKYFLSHKEIRRIVFKSKVKHKLSAVFKTIMNAMFFPNKA